MASSQKGDELEELPSRSVSLWQASYAWLATVMFLPWAQANKLCGVGTGDVQTVLSSPLYVASCVLCMPPTPHLRNFM